MSRRIVFLAALAVAFGTKGFGDAPTGQSQEVTTMRKTLVSLANHNQQEES
jgi:hypothetical protein